MQVRKATKTSRRFLHSSNKGHSILLRGPSMILEPPTKRRLEMITAITLNIVFAGIAFASILGLIGWSIATAQRDGGLRLARGARQARRVPAEPSIAAAPQPEAA